jgi:hypothetical protein
MRCAEEISAMWHTGHSEETHSPDECAMGPLLVRFALACLMVKGRIRRLMQLRNQAGSL